MGRYFGRQPRYSREEAEAQAKAALDAALNKGRPPEEEWKALGSRMGEINRELAARPPVDLPSPPPRRAATDTGSTAGTKRPRAINEILRPPPAPAPPPAPRPRKAAAAAPAPAKRATAAPAKRATKGEPAAGTPTKRSTRTENAAPAPAKRPATKKRPG